MVKLGLDREWTRWFQVGSCCLAQNRLAVILTSDVRSPKAQDVGSQSTALCRLSSTTQII